MSLNNIQKQAQKDATEYAAAYMAYGEGAGTRRKLIEGTVDYKMQFVPGYRDAFVKYHEHQDMAKHARNAKLSNRRKRANEVVVRNTKAAVTGKYENLNTGLLILGATVYALRTTGYDKKLIDLSKRTYKDVKRKFKKTTPDTVHNITNV